MLLGALAPRDVCELVIGHSMPELDQVYDLGSRLDEKRAALTAWADALERIVSPPPVPLRSDNVLALRA